MERRVIWAIALMLFIAVAPTFFFKQPPRKPVPSQTRPDTSAKPRPAQPTMQAAPTGGLNVESVSRPAQTVTVSSPLYRHQISTRGGAIEQVSILKYPTLTDNKKGGPVQLLPDEARLNQLAILVGQDTLKLSQWDFTPSTTNLSLTGPDSLVLQGARGNVAVRLVYHFKPDDYEVMVTGTATGLGPVGGHLVIDMGRGMRQSEADSNANYYEYGVVTKTDESSLLRFSKLKSGELRTINGPFEWAAVKSKYFVTAVLTVEENGPRLSGVTLSASREQPVHHADVSFGFPVAASGTFSYGLYAGPMEYPRLKAIGHDFYDINPYGWPGFRTMIRPIAVGARWLLVYMHEHMAIAYGMVLVLFGIGIRILLWPLNQKGMRAGLRMQALQPEMQRIQDQYKSDPPRMQKEMMELYKREGVNPFSGCWPMLLPWPILLALFFVFANTIELRGQSFLWLPDLSLKDPYYILPVLMGLSMFGLSKVGMSGMPPSPQAKMMLYFLPIMMTVMFFSFASGLNLYYFVQNVASIPQQWLLARERKRRAAEMAVVVNTKPAPSGGGGKKKK